MNDPELASVFDRAEQLVHHRWIRFESAKDKDGLKVHPCDPSAEMFCTAGAFYRAISEAHPDAGPDFDLCATDLYDRGYSALTELIGSASIGIWNDTYGRTQEEVESTFHLLAARARSEA